MCGKNFSWPPQKPPQNRSSEKEEDIKKLSLPKGTLDKILKDFDIKSAEKADYPNLAEKIKNKLKELSESTDKENQEVFKLEIKKIKDGNGVEIDHPQKFRVNESGQKIEKSYMEILEGFWGEIESKIGYLDEVGKETKSKEDPKSKIEFAFWTACYIHAGDRRQTTGMLYMIHIKEVVMGALDMHLDVDSVVSAMLHDTSEDHSEDGYTDKGKNPDWKAGETSDFITKHFGPKVGYMVALLNKQNYEGSDYHKHFKEIVYEDKIEEIDIKVVLLKITDYLMNISSPNNTEPEKEKKMIEKGFILFELAKELKISSIVSKIELLILEQYFSDSDKATQLLNKKKEIDESLEGVDFDSLGLKEEDVYINYNIPSFIEKVKNPDKNDKFEGFRFRIREEGFLQKMMNSKTPQVFVKSENPEGNREKILSKFTGNGWSVEEDRSQKSGIKGNLDYKGQQKINQVITLSKNDQKIKLNIVSLADFEWYKFGEVSFLGEINNKLEDYKKIVEKSIKSKIMNFFKKIPTFVGLH